MRKDKFPNEKMDYIISYLWRKCSGDKGQIYDINTRILSSIILEYFQFEGEYRNYVKEFVDDILSNYHNVCCWIILDWNKRCIKWFILQLWKHLKGSVLD